jgi:hypothetical protein
MGAFAPNGGCGLPRAFGPRNDESLEVWDISVGAGSVMARKEARNVPTLVIASEARQSIGLHLRDALPVHTAACLSLPPLCRTLCLRRQEDCA